MYKESSKRRVYVHTCIRGGCHKSWGMTPGLPLLASLTSTILSDIFTIRIHVSTRDDIQSGGTAGRGWYRLYRWTDVATSRDESYIQRVFAGLSSIIYFKQYRTSRSPFSVMSIVKRGRKRILENFYRPILRFIPFQIDFANI